MASVSISQHDKITYLERTYYWVKNIKVFYHRKTIKGKCDFDDSNDPSIQVKSGTYLIQQSL